MVAIVLILIETMAATKAQNIESNINQSVLNGLFSPTASERFFEEGKLNIEREVKILTNPERYQREDILQDNTLNMKIFEEMEETNPILNFPQDRLQK